MKIVGVVFARLDSSRFPGKALASFCGQPLVLHVLSRASLSKELDSVVLATTTRASDDPLAEIVSQNGFTVFRGDYENVAARALNCATSLDAKAFARLNGDSPCIDVKLLDLGCIIMRKYKPKFVTNLAPKRTYPYGVAVELIDTNFFLELQSHPRSIDEQEHLTKVFYNNLSNIAYKRLPSCKYSLQTCQLTVDRPEDLSYVEKKYKISFFDDGSVDYSVL